MRFTPETADKKEIWIKILQTQLPVFLVENLMEENRDKWRGTQPSREAEEENKVTDALTKVEIQLESRCLQCPLRAPNQSQEAARVEDEQESCDGQEDSCRKQVQKYKGAFWLVPAVAVCKFCIKVKCIEDTACPNVVMRSNETLKKR